MKLRDYLTDLLAPGDDGRAFTDAVLLRASGALYRRRTAGAAADAPAWAWLERWARPWVVALLVVLSVAIAIPALPSVGSRSQQADSGVDALVSSTTPDVVLAAASGN